MLRFISFFNFIIFSYKSTHAKLLDASTPHGIKEYSNMRILDVFAYYLGDLGVSDADRGTVLRFIERKGTTTLLQGLSSIKATFETTSWSVYSDHWVSNVVSRKGFLKTLEDTLGFTPKVDFNAGVVAAGEARIESTVTVRVKTLIKT